MTIQLTAPILIAGVHQASGTSLTLGADVEAELVNRGVAVYTSAPVVIRKDVPFVFDDAGNLIANVNHRTGTLATLLALAGGEGEISVATDVEALIVHNGVEGEAVEYRRTRDHLALVAGKSSLSVGTGADTVITTWTETLDAVGAFNATDGEYTIPAGYAAMSINVVVDWGDAAIASANLRRIIMQIEALPGVWVDFFGARSATSIASAKTVMNYTLPFVDATTYAGKKLRIALRHEAGSTLGSIIVSADMRLMK